VLTRGFKQDARSVTLPSLPGALAWHYHDYIMAKATNHIPEGLHSLTAHLTIKGAADYIDFLKRAFGAVEVRRVPGPGGKIMHAHVKIGDSNLMLNDHFPEMGSPEMAEGTFPLTLDLYVPDADTVFAQATAAGCQVTMPLADQFWGDRYGQLKDPFGFNWAILTHKEDLTPAELQERMSKQSF